MLAFILGIDSPPCEGILSFGGAIALPDLAARGSSELIEVRG